MKYALKYFSTSKILDKVDEIKIKYKEFNPALLDFVQDHINQRIIVDYRYTGSANEQNVELFAEALKINSKLISLRFCSNRSNATLMSYAINYLFKYLFTISLNFSS